MICFVTEEFHKTLNIIFICPMVLSGCLKLLVVEAAKKVDE